MAEILKTGFKQTSGVILAGLIRSLNIYIYTSVRHNQLCEQDYEFQLIRSMTLPAPCR